MVPRWLKAAFGVFAVVVASALAFAILEPIQVLPRIRLAPGYALTDADGRTVTSETARGELTLYTFAPTDCDSACDDIFTTMDEVGRRVDAEVDLGRVDFRRITIALDPEPTSAELSSAMTRSGADGWAWRWLGGEEAVVRQVVGAGFRRFYEADRNDPAAPIRFDPGYVLVDGTGVIRGEYRYQTLASDADKLVHHVDILAAEVRNASGATAVAYEAAHLFLCYP